MSRAHPVLFYFWGKASRTWRFPRRHAEDASGHEAPDCYRQCEVWKKRWQVGSAERVERRRSTLLAAEWLIYYVSQRRQASSQGCLVLALIRKTFFYFFAMNPQVCGEYSEIENNKRVKGQTGHCVCNINYILYSWDTSCVLNYILWVVYLK